MNKLQNNTRRYLAVISAMLLIAGEYTVAEAAEIAAKVGDIEITVAEITALARQESAATPLSAVARAEAVKRLVLAQARNARWEQRPDVQAQLAKMSEQVILENYLVAQTEPEAKFPTEEQIKSAYEQNPALFTLPAQVQVAQIFIRAAEKDDAAKLKVDTVAADLRANPQSFSTLARRISDHAASAQRGGELGWVAESDLTPEVAAAMKTLQVGAISAPLRAAQGWHIVKLLERRGATLQPLAAVRATIVEALRREKAAHNRQNYIAQLLKENPISINEIALTKAGDAPKK